MVFDVTSDVDPNGGPYYVGFSYDRGDYAAHVQRLAVLRSVEGAPTTPLAVSPDEPLYLGRWERWHEAKIVVPPGAGQNSVLLEIVLKADVPAKPGKDDWQCCGSIGLRRAWPEDVEYRRQRSGRGNRH